MTQLESWYTPKVGQWRGISDLASWKQADSGDLYWQIWRKKSLARSISHTNQVPEDMLICSSNETSSGTNSCNYSHHLVKVTIIHCHYPSSISPLHRPNQCIKWEWAGNYHPCNFQVLDGGTNLSHLFRNRVLPWITIFLYKNNTVDVQPLSSVWLFATPWTATCQASLSFTISWSLLKLTSIELVMPYNHLILCHPPLLLLSIFPSIRVFSWVELALHIMWPKYWSFNFSLSPSNEYSGLITFRID